MHIRRMYSGSAISKQQSAARNAAPEQRLPWLQEVSLSVARVLLPCVSGFVVCVCVCTMRENELI